MRQQTTKTQTNDNRCSVQMAHEHLPALDYERINTHLVGLCAFDGAIPGSSFPCCLVELFTAAQQEQLVQLLYAADELEGTIFLDSAVAVLHFFLSLLEAGEKAVPFFLVQFCPNRRLLSHLIVLDHHHNFLKRDNLATATSTHFGGQQSMLSRTER